MKLRISIWVALLGLFAQAPLALAAGQDCELAKRYVALAEQRAKAFASDEERVFLKQSIDACPTWDAYQRLGELGAQSSDTEQLDQAVQAFVTAFGLAPTDTARARTLYQYARLLTMSGDPQNAYPLVKQARGFDANNADILALEQQLEPRVQNPTPEDIVRGLKDSLYRPINTARTRPRNDAAGSAAPVAAREVAQPSVSVRINFETGSTEIDALTRPNLEILARTLTAPKFAGDRFVFVGHADMRGDEYRNLDLSRERALAIYRELVAIEPSLEGRVDVEGRGSGEPIDTGRNEAAYRANRRLQVFIK
jgi:outer membrane protein OmpA-like peptidoglycan-associated protein